MAKGPQNIVRLFPIDQQRSTIAAELDGLARCHKDVNHYLESMSQWDDAGKAHAQEMAAIAIAKASIYAGRAQMIDDGYKIYKPR